MFAAHPTLLFERAADSVGLDFLAHPFWDKYIEFEERFESKDNVFGILARVIHIPLHQYARYFEKYRTMAAQRPIEELAPPDVVAKLRNDGVKESGQKQRNPSETERDLRTKIDAHHLEVFNRTQTETTKRWTYEQGIKRPYYHVTELDDEQLTNWRKYLDFEEVEGDYTRAKFLYERCLVTCANYDEFWYRYARWTMGQTSKPKEVRDEEVRNIYRRASCTYIFISSPEIRLHYAKFEESLGKADTAIAIHEAILMNLPGHLETILSLVNTHRRQYGIDSAIGVLTSYLSSESPLHTSSLKGSLVAELARLTWKVKGNADEARSIYQTYQQQCLDSRAYWKALLSFEVEQPTSEKEEAQRYKRIKSVYGDIRTVASLPSSTAKELASNYLDYLDQRSGKEAMAEWTAIDKEINGPFSIVSGFGHSGKGALENGHGIA